MSADTSAGQDDASRARRHEQPVNGLRRRAHAWRTSDASRGRRGRRLRRACPRRASSATSRASRSRWSTDATTTSSSRCCTRSRPASSRPGRSRRRSDTCCAACRSVSVELLEVDGFDLERRVVHAIRPPGGERVELPYDTLIVAAGAGQSYFGHDEFALYAPGMKTIDDAMELRRRILGALELAETATTPEERREWLTIVVVGAGPTGVEIAGQIRELAVRSLQREFTHVRSGVGAGGARRRRQGATRCVRRSALARPPPASSKTSVWNCV